MIILLFFASIAFFPHCLADCIPPKTYGTSCQFSCTNCSTGCDITGACYNGTCLVGFYGTGCQMTNIAFSQPPTLNASNCSVTVSSASYTNTTNIIQTALYVVYGPSQTSNSIDYTLWQNKSNMTCTVQTCQATVFIPGGNYYFGIYFDFMDLNYADTQHSLVSPLSQATCNSTSIPPVTTTTTTSTTTSPSVFTGTTISTLSTKPIISQTTTPVPSSISSVSLGSTLSSSVSSSLLSALVGTSTTSSSSTSSVINNSASNITWLNPTPSSTTISWKAPVNLNNFLYYIVIITNAYQIQTANASSSTQSFYSLLPGNQYTVVVTSVYGNSPNVNVSTIMCTNPTNNVTIDNTQIISIDRKSITVVFPLDRTGYTCSTTFYLLGIIQTVTSNRRKRAVSDNSIIPSGATIKYNNSVAPTKITLDGLISGTNYTIYAVIYTNVNGIVTFYYSTTYQSTNGPTDGAIAGIVIGIILLMLLIIAIILLLLYWRRRKRGPFTTLTKSYNETKLKEIVDDNKPLSYAYWTNISDKMKPRYLVLNPNEWTDDLEKMEAMKFNYKNYVPAGVRFIEEYNDLPNELTYSCKFAEINYAKNKKQDIVPYDHNRVKLKSSNLNGEGDYVNASFIEGYIRKKAFIASQSPFNEETVNDFWRMIYDHNVGQIVMLTEAQHDNIVTSVIYWPQINTKSKSRGITYGTINVNIVNQFEFAYYDIREFEIKDITCTLEPQLVTQYQFHGWPHNDIPQNCIAFIDFYHAIKIRANISDGPLLVHCGSGISQTGVYIAFDKLNQQVTHENCVNVFRVAAEIRRSRSKMITNSKQYMFIYDLLFESLLCGQFIVNYNIKMVIKLLQNVNPQSQIEYLREQFYLLQTYHTITTSSRTSGTKEISYVDCIDSRQSLCTITSPPMINERINYFWNAVFEKDIDVIVDLRTTDDKPYYLLDNLQNFDITINEISQIGEFLQIFEITLVDIRNKSAMNISIYQMGTDWVKNNNIYSEPNQKYCEIWVELMDHLILNHSRNRILVHCIDGWSKSGLFLACYNAAVKMCLSKYVMVYNVVKSLKFYRYEFVTSYEQFRFIFDFLKKWVDMKMPYEAASDKFSGLLNDGTLKESLFTHEQTPVYNPYQRYKYAPSLYNLGADEYSHITHSITDKQVVVHYTVATINDFIV